MRIVLIVSMTVLLSCLVPAKGNATGVDEESTKKYDIAGGVFLSATKKPLANVSITAYSASRKEKVVLTNDKGQYFFDELKSGTYKFVFEKEGYRKVVKEKVVVRQDEAVHLDIEMEEHVVFDFMPGPFNFTDFQE